MVIKEELQISDKVDASGGFSDVRVGTYKGCRVAVKRVRVAMSDNLLEMRKVNSVAISSAIRV